MSLKERDYKILQFIEEFGAITISQSSSMFFNGSYEASRRRLRILEQNYYKLKSFKLKETDEKIYILSNGKKVSYHDILCLNFIKELKIKNCDILQVKKTPRFMNNKIIPDMFCVFAYEGQVYFTLIEMDLNHFTGISKMQRYEELYKSRELQDNYCHGTFPIIIIARKTNGLRYNSKNFNCIYSDLDFSNLSSLLF